MKLVPSPNVPQHPDIPRSDPDLQAGELQLLGQFLDYHRATLQLKCAGLNETQLKARAVPPSALTLLGLVRHLSEVEYGWFGECLDDQEERSYYCSEDDPDGDFHNLDGEPVEQVWATWNGVVAESRRILATYTDGGEPARGGGGRPRNLRWVLVHMIEEYARHNGHADLLRESIDGTIGE